MKRIRVYLLLWIYVLSLAGCSNLIEDNKTPQALGAILFDAFKTGDHDKFQHYCATNEEIEAAFKVVKQAILKKIPEKPTPAEEASFDKAMTTNRSSLLQSLKQNFSAAQQEAAQCGIHDLSTIEFISCTFQEPTSFRKSSTKLVSLDVSFRWHGLEYKIQAPVCMLTKRGWVLLSGMTLNCKN